MYSLRANFLCEICFKQLIYVLSSEPFFFLYVILPRPPPPRPRILLSVFCVDVLPRFVIPLGAIFFFFSQITFSYFASSFLFGRKVRYYKLSYIFFVFSYHFVLLSLRPSSPVHFSPHSLFSRLRFAFISVNSIFSFSRGTANPSLLHCTFASRFFLLPTAVHLPPHCHFYFVFSAARQASLYLPRVSV